TMNAPTSSLFPSVVAGLEQFRDRVAGDEGSYRVALTAAGQSTAIIDVAVEILRVIRDVLEWLRDGLDGLGDRLVSVDALVALVESLGTLVAELGAVLDPAVLALPAPGLSEVQGGIASGLGQVGELLASAPALDLLPGPETFAGLQAVLQDLVGPVDEAHPDADVLGDLLNQLQGLGAA
ncbi:MAG: hypothetical protein AB1Z98_32075, partial [Nannocystaceae bacterium]